MFGYTSALGQPALREAPKVTYTPEQQRYVDADRQAARICIRVMRERAGGASVMLTDPNFLACVKQGRDLILGGKTPEEVEAMIRAGGGAVEAGMGPNWLVWGGIAAGVLIVGYLMFFRK